MTLDGLAIQPEIPADAIGIPLAMANLSAILIVLVVVILFLALGLRVLRLLHLTDLHPAERAVFGVALGIGAFGTAALLLGLGGLLNREALAALATAFLVIARHEVAELPALACAILKQPEPGGSTGLRRLAVVTTVLAGVFLVTLSLTPTVDWDSLLLHLRVPAQFLVEGRVYVPPDNLPSGFAGVIHMVYAALLATGNPRTPAVLSAAIALLLGGTVHLVTRRLFDRDAAHLALVAFWGCSIIWMVAVTPRVDVTLAFFALLTHYALLKCLLERADGPDPRRRALLTLAALLAGFMVSVKYQGLVYGLALAPLIVLACARGRSAQTAIRSVAVFGAVATGLALPWIAKNLVLFGAPFAPMFMGITSPPWMADLLGTGPLVFDRPPAFAGADWQLSEPFNLVDFFFAPNRLTIEAEAVFYHSTPLLLALPLVALFWRDRVRTPMWLAGPSLAFATILLVYAPRTNLRYLIPAVVVLTIVSAGATVRTVRAIFTDGRARGLVLSGLCGPLAVLPSLFPLVFFATRSLAVAHAIGATSPAEFNATRPFENVLPRVAAETRQRVPAESRLLLLFEPRGHLFGHSALQDSQMNNWPLLAHAAADIGCLEEAGITHVLVNEYSLQYRIDRGFSPSAFGWTEFPAFREGCLRPLYDFDGYTLYEVFPRRGRTSPAP